MWLDQVFRITFLLFMLVLIMLMWLDAWRRNRQLRRDQKEIDEVLSRLNRIHDQQSGACCPKPTSDPKESRQQ
jgi:Na+/H+ antiporter NhaC